MIDREKSKMKKARAAEQGGDGDGDAEGEAAKTPKGKVSHFLISLTAGAFQANMSKRKAGSEAGSAPKKAKTPRKTKTKSSEDTEKVKEDIDSAGVKAEPEDADASN